MAPPCLAAGGHTTQLAVRDVSLAQQSGLGGGGGGGGGRGVYGSTLVGHAAATPTAARVLAGTRLRPTTVGTPKTLPTLALRQLLRLPTNELTVTLAVPLRTTMSREVQSPPRYADITLPSKKIDMLKPLALCPPSPPMVVALSSPQEVQHTPRGNGPTREKLIGLFLSCGMWHGSAGGNRCTPLPAAVKTVRLAATHGAAAPSPTAPTLAGCTRARGARPKEARGSAATSWAKGLLDVPTHVSCGRATHSSSGNSRRRSRHRRCAAIIVMVVSAGGCHTMGDVRPHGCGRARPVLRWGYAPDGAGHTPCTLRKPCLWSMCLAAAIAVACRLLDLPLRPSLS
jgi:hypothetical protein